MVIYDGQQHDVGEMSARGALCASQALCTGLAEGAAFRLCPFLVITMITIQGRAAIYNQFPLYERAPDRGI
ncbi:MAG: hypothetical protein ACPGWR_18820 [Ardenticatenaceae bacterium]